MKLAMSKTNEDYLEAIYIFELNDHQPELKSVDLASTMHVSRAAVNKATNELKKRELIHKNDYGKISLTEKGRRIAKEIYHKHLIIKELLLRLGVDNATADIECCLIEHAVSDTTIALIEDFLRQ